MNQTKNYQIHDSYIRSNNFTNILIKNQVTGAQTQTISFFSKGNGASRVSENETSGEQTRIIALDDYFDEIPTLIKMDVEGFEIETLKGAKKIIKSLKPKLAISIYHKPLDFYEIPLYIKSLMPDYKFKIRQHDFGFYDTVLYAYI